jgi:hypothetical protein
MNQNSRDILGAYGTQDAKSRLIRDYPGEYGTVNSPNAYGTNSYQFYNTKFPGHVIVNP